MINFDLFIIPQLSGDFYICSFTCLLISVELFVSWHNHQEQRVKLSSVTKHDKPWKHIFVLARRKATFQAQQQRVQNDHIGGLISFWFPLRILWQLLRFHSQKVKVRSLLPNNPRLVTDTVVKLDKSTDHILVYPSPCCSKNPVVEIVIINDKTQTLAANKTPRITHNVALDHDRPTKIIALLKFRNKRQMFKGSFKILKWNLE